MKNIIISIIGCILVHTCIASVATYSYPIDYSFVTYSPTSEAYGVQAIFATSTSNWLEHIRFQVFEASSGNLLWQSNTNYGWSTQVYLMQDPNYVFCVNTDFNIFDICKQSGTCWLDIIVRTTKEDGKTIQSINTNISDKVQHDWLNNKWAIRVYRRNKLLRSYSLSDLDIPLTSLKFSCRHAELADTPSATNPKWDLNPFALPGELPNPRFVDNQIYIDCFDDMTRVFNLKTGELIETKKTEMLQQIDGSDS